MKKRIVIGIVLLISLSSIISQQKFNTSKFNLTKINTENNFILSDKEINNLLLPIYNKNLIFLKNEEIKQALQASTFIESFKIKKKYPDTLVVEIFEKRPIAILFDQKKKYFLSDKIDLIEFKDLKDFENLPYVEGNKDDFKKLYKNLEQLNFPFETVKKYTLFNSMRWDLETKSNKIIKLPITGYNKSIENFLDLKKKNNLKKYKIFDYRIKNQLILK
tara:strand:+ start:6761 stop:7417 length:657 start_codon:yes stop_codon:yes gene_type:complete